MHDIATRLCEAVQTLAPKHRGELRPMPSSQEVGQLLALMRGILFPGYFLTAELGSAETFFSVGHALCEATRLLARQVARATCFASPGHSSNCRVCTEQAHAVVEQFVERLPTIQNMLLADVRAAYEGDPAATGPEETILSYPGVWAITCQRLAHQLYSAGVPLLPRMITEYAHAQTGIDIHPGARIGERFFVDHGTGVVIGETCILGANVRLYQGVTLGARSFRLDEAGNPVKGLARHPILEDDVTVYAGATVLGRITVGRGSIIGGNVWLTESVAPGSIITQSASRREAYDGGGGI